MAWLPPSRQIRLLHSVLEGMGIHYCLLPPYLPDILTSKDSIWRQLEILSMEHSGAGGASQWSFIFFTSLALWGWLKEACIFCTSLLQLGTPSTANNSLHQSGVSVTLAFHITHLQSSHTGLSSSELSTDPLRKEVTPSSNSGSSPTPSNQWSPPPCQTLDFLEVGGREQGCQWITPGNASSCTLWLPASSGLYSLTSPLLLANSRGRDGSAFLFLPSGQQQWPVPSGGLLLWELSSSL